MNRNEIRKNVGFSVVRRDFRQTHGEPEVSKAKAKRKQSRPKKVVITCKHVWVGVTYSEYLRYQYPHYGEWWWKHLAKLDTKHPSFYSHFVCAGCGAAKTKRDKAAERASYRKQAAKRRAAK